MRTWREVRNFVSQKFRLTAGWQATLQDGPVGCTLRWASGLHIKLGCGIGRAGGLLFSAARPALFRSPLYCTFVQLARPPFCLLCSPPAEVAGVIF